LYKREKVLILLFIKLGKNPMTITIKDVEHIAQLAKLDFSPEEKKLIQKDLNQIIKYFNKLNELETSHVEPLSHAQDIVNKLRPDQVKPSLPVEEVLKNAPDRSGTFFKVPKVIK
jgi:aspartyl-tRNA(Asn)/glutamyl-tRNA(Gln) amidotransferase subunit C